MNVKEVSAKWFEVTIAYDSVTENGETKKVAEVVTINAMSFAEAETKALEEYACIATGDTDVTAIKIAKYGSVFIPQDNTVVPTFYNIKLAFITLDEKTEKEKRTNVQYLIGASNLEDARKTIENVLDQSMIDYVFVGVTESKVVEVYSE